MSQHCGETGLQQAGHEQKNNGKQMGGGVSLAPISSTKPFSELREAEEERIFFFFEVGKGNKQNRRRNTAYFAVKQKFSLFKNQGNVEEAKLLHARYHGSLGFLDPVSLKVLEFGLDCPEWVGWGLTRPAQVLGKGGYV